MNSLMNQKYAVLFKTFTWSEFDKRQIARLEAVCRSGEIFIFKDQTRTFHPVDSTYKVFHALEAHSQLLGLANNTGDSVFWYNNDYPLYYFLLSTGFSEKGSKYDYIYYESTEIS